MPTTPDRVYIDKEDRSLYEKIENENIFKEKTRKEQFLFAMAIGFENDIKQPLSNKESSGLFLLKDLGPEDKALINAVALHESNSIEVLADKGKVFKIAEEYAHAGIKLLVDKIESTQFGSFHKQLEKELHEIYGRLFSNKDNGKNIIS